MVLHVISMDRQICEVAGYSEGFHRAVWDSGKLVVSSLCFVPSLMRFSIRGRRGGMPRGGPAQRGRPMPYVNNYQQPPQNQNQQLPVQSQQPPSSAENSSKSSTPIVVTQQQQPPKTAAVQPAPTANVPTNAVPNNQSAGPAPSRGASNAMRGNRNGTMRGGRVGGYNPNINVTGNDMPSQNSPPHNKPFYRGNVTRGRGNFQQCPSGRPGPMPVAPNHQPPGGMLQQGNCF